MSSDAEFDEANALSTAEKTAAPSTPTKRKRFVWSEGMIECCILTSFGDKIPTDMHPVFHLVRRCSII
ncbi:hypothetical protein PF011_g30478 [Phytophthora fragariae]|uniref:Uncharacterized protein n=1 Tax=Phytophthora fragariae TaxID=53985 RepID=A0A6A3GPJ7_9STRA|nr:hypothetical protein PF011_g30478 [Phytophthora fragariae]